MVAIELCKENIGKITDTKFNSIAGQGGKNKGEKEIMTKGIGMI